MKKIVSLFIALCLIFVLSACASKESAELSSGNYYAVSASGDITLTIEVTDEATYFYKDGASYEVKVDENNATLELNYGDWDYTISYQVKDEEILVIDAGTTIMGENQSTLYLEGSKSLEEAVAGAASGG